MTTPRSREEAIKVRFAGMELWWLKNSDGSGALAPLDHCDDKGHVLNPFAVSFAHVYPSGEISRFGEIIGKRDDLFRDALTKKNPTDL